MTENNDNTLTAGEDAAIDYYRNWLDTHSVEDDKAREVRQRRERSKRIIAAVSDGLSALGGLVFAGSKGGASVHQGNVMLDAVGAGIQRAKEARDKEKDTYDRYKIKFAEAKAAKAKKLRDIADAAEEAKYKQARENRAEQEFKWKGEQHPLEIALAQGRVDEQGYKTKITAAEAAVAPEMSVARLNSERGRADVQKASAEELRALAAEHDRSNVDRFSAWDDQGEEHKFRTTKDADWFARQQETFQEGSIQSTTTVNDGRNTKTTISTKPGGGYPAKPKSNSKTMPGVSSEKGNGKGNGNGNKMPGVK